MLRSSLRRALLVLACALAAGGPAPRAGAEQAAGGLWIDPARGIVALRAEVLVKEDLLEYLLVAAHGATHESLFVTDVAPTLLNAALLAAGAQPGRNASWEEVPGATGRDAYRVVPPDGDAPARFRPYVAWREDGEDYFFRVEDTVVNLESGRSMRRHDWIYLGSRFAGGEQGGEPEFLAQAEGNLINLSFFFEGNTLLTAALPACLSQTIWVGNRALLPERGSGVTLVLSRTPLGGLPPECRDAVGARGE